ncbi:MAG: TniQ family protein [Pseudorhodobacter sp.]
MTGMNIQHRVDAVTDGVCDEWRYHVRSKRLPLSVEMQPRETATSLFSRLSVANGLPRMPGLCRDFGTRYGDLCNGDPEAVRRVAELAGADPDLLQQSTPQVIEPGWFQLGRARIKFTAMLRNGGQICPLCVVEDECRDRQFGPYQRDIWQVAAFRRCPKHAVAFERSQFGCRHWEVHDFAQVLKTWSPAGILHLGSEDSSLQDHLLRRIREGSGRAWVDDQAFHVTWLFSEALGTLLTQGPKARMATQSIQALVRSGATGFELMSAGRNAILAALSDIRDQAGGDRDAYGKLYGPVLSCLLDRRKDPAFDALRHLVREFILDNFRVPPGSSLLGEKCPETRVFTAWSASKHFDVPLSLLSRQLRQEGQLTGSLPNNKSDRTLLIPKAQVEAMVAEVRQLHSVTVTRAVLGADRHVMDRLCASGLLTPHFPHDGGLPVYHQDEIMRFLKRLQEAVSSRRKPSRYWRPVTSAAARTHCSTVWILQQVFGGRLPLAARLADPFQLADFLVPVNQLKAMLSALPEGLVTAAEAARWLGADIKTTHALAIDGYLPSTIVESRLVNRPQRLIAKPDLERFTHRYIVLRALVGQRKASYAATLAFIEDQGVFPILTRDGIRPVYERRKIERLSLLTGGEQLARLIEVEETRPDLLSKPVLYNSGEGLA